MILTVSMVTPPVISEVAPAREMMVVIFGPGRNQRALNRGPTTAWRQTHRRFPIPTTATIAELQQPLPSEIVMTGIATSDPPQTHPYRILSLLMP